MKLVTGGTGFTGSWLVCYLLKAGYRVRAMRRASSNLQQYRQIASVFFNLSPEQVPEPEWIIGDLNDALSLYEALDSCDTVYHTAALVSFHRSDREELLRINAEGTAQLVNFMLELGIRRLGYVSSTSALGKTEDGNAINLSTPWKNHPGLSGYAISKKRAELEVWRGMEEGLEVRVVNPGIIVGYGDWNKGSCATFRQVYDGLKFYSTGANGFVDVRDVCTQLIEMVEQPTDEKQRLLVGRNMTYQSYFEHIANAFGLKPPHLKIGKSLAQLAGALSGVPSFLGFKAHFLTPEIARSATTKATYVEKEGLIPIETSITFAAACYKKFQSSGG